MKPNTYISLLHALLTPLLFASLLCCQRELNEPFIECNIPENTSDNNRATRSLSTVEYLGHRYTVSESLMSIDEARAHFSDSTLLPTHLALRVSPKSMEQLHRLEADKSLTIFYHPFGYELFPDGSEMSSVNSGTSLNKNTIMDTPFEQCDIEVKEYDSRPISPVFVLWPVSSPIPSDIEYDSLFQAYIPLNREILEVPDPQLIPHVAGYLKSYDSRTATYTPVKNVEVEFFNGFATSHAYTDSIGYFFLPFAESNHQIVINLRNDKFAVRDNLTSNVKSLAIAPYITLSLTDPDYRVNIPSNFYFDVYKSADYYFDGQNDLLTCIPKYDTSGDIMDIHAIDSSSDNYLGAFYYSLNNSFSPYIQIWNPYNGNYTGATSKVLGTVNHELGHATHYVYSGATVFYNTDNIVKESFASFVGWYNVFRYYYSLVGNNHYDVHSICTQGRQSWTPDLSGSSVYYSPLFIDLFDNYDQSTVNTTFNVDLISNVPVPFIPSSALSSQSLQDVITILQSGIGTHYSSAEFNTFIAPYSTLIP